MKVHVIGSGAVGCYFGFKLSQSGAEVSLQARSDYDQIKAHGVYLTTTEGDFYFTPPHVVRQASELPEKPDYVMVCVKLTKGVDRVALLKGAVGPETAIVLLSNGIDVEREVAEAFPDNEIISALAFVGVTRTAPGRIHHQSYGHLSMGSYPSGVSEKTRLLAEAYLKAGVKCAATPDIATARWQKCVWNASFNPISVLSGLDTGAILACQEAFVREVMAEVCAIAAATGHPLPDGLVEKSIQSTHKMPPYKTSMLVDHEHGHPLELEPILGNAVRAGQSAGVSIPRLESIYSLMKLKELAGEKQAQE